MADNRFPSLLSFFMSSCLILFSSNSSAFQFSVGGRRDGWVVKPSENYTHWAERLRFQVNDTLFFKYPKGSDSVLVVNRDDYDNCNINNPILKLDDGNLVFKFDHSGPFYFISGNKSHCDQGQKLIVVVLAVRTRSPPTSPTNPSISTPPAASPPGGSAPSPSSPSSTPAPVPSPAEGSSSPSPSNPSPTSAPVPLPAGGSSSPLSNPSPTSSPVPSSAGGSSSPTPSNSPARPNSPPSPPSNSTPTPPSSTTTPSGSGLPATSPPGNGNNPPAAQVSGARPSFTYGAVFTSAVTVVTSVLSIL